MSDEFNNDYYNLNNNGEGENGDSNNTQNNNENTANNSAYSLNNNSEPQNQTSQQNANEPQSGYSVQNNNYNPNNGYYNYNNQSPYQNNNYNNSNYNNSNYSNNNRNNKKPWSFGKKLAVVALTATLVGVGVGGALLGSQVIYKNVPITTSSQAAEQEASDSAQTETKLANQLSVADADTGLSSKAVVLDVSDVVAETLPSVVAITNTIVYSGNVMGQTIQQEGEANGSGVIISKSDTELLIVTNNHVIATDESTGSSYYYNLTTSSGGIKVTFSDDTTAEANLKGTDEDADLAVIAVQLSNLSSETLDTIKVATIGNSNDMKVGQAVIAIGNALGYGQSTTFGIVSALNREVSFTDSSSNQEKSQQQGTGESETTTQKLLQTDAAINPGNSGGGLFNMAGQLIGINAAKYSDTDVEGMGYAIPITEASDTITGLMNQETKVTYSKDEQGYLGITGDTVGTSLKRYYSFPEGAYIASVVENAAAAKAGIKQYDVITKLNDTKIITMEGLKKELTYYKSGDTVNITLKRMENGTWNEMTVSVTLSSRAEASVDTTTEADNQDSNQSVNPFFGR